MSPDETEGLPLLPDDVWREASRVAEEVQRTWNHFYAPTAKEVRMVAAAIQSERERCAKIADDMTININATTETDPLAAFQIGVRAAKRAIGRVIRNGAA